MSRLIDAEELERVAVTVDGRLVVYLTDIHNAPTVNDCPNCEYKLEADYICSSSSYKELIDLRKFKEENKRPHGEWLYVDNDLGTFQCDQCKKHSSINYYFCPNCGADMRGEEE